VYAVDVGHGQLAWKLRRDSRVVVMEQTNARHLTPRSFPPPFAPVDLAVIDCSFISLRKILPAAIAILRASGKIVALVKPQFEAGRGEVPGGVVRSPAVHRAVLERVIAMARGIGLVPLDVVRSPLLGPAGNREFFVHLLAPGERAVDRPPEGPGRDLAERIVECTAP
jgi:23S rRNA (cytidine1920-2'-O)/16S rRNA (cytidine1409-2'-O)-methyltransferase